MIKFEIKTSDMDTPVQIEQDEDGLFTVSYGLDIKESLTYSRAARELGQCIMHSMTCAGCFIGSED